MYLVNKFECLRRPIGRQSGRVWRSTRIEMNRGPRLVVHYPYELCETFDKANLGRNFEIAQIDCGASAGATWRFVGFGWRRRVGSWRSPTNSAQIWFAEPNVSFSRTTKVELSVSTMLESPHSSLSLSAGLSHCSPFASNWLQLEIFLIVFSLQIADCENRVYHEFIMTL